MNEATAAAIRKLDAIFEAAPWLKDSKNIVHMPVKGYPRDEGLKWSELKALVDHALGE